MKDIETKEYSIWLHKAMNWPTTMIYSRHAYPEPPLPPKKSTLSLETTGYDKIYNAFDRIELMFNICIVFSIFICKNACYLCLWCEGKIQVDSGKSMLYAQNKAEICTLKLNFNKTMLIRQDERMLEPIFIIFGAFHYVKLINYTYKQVSYYFISITLIYNIKHSLCTCVAGGYIVLEAPSSGVISAMVYITEY